MKEQLPRLDTSPEIRAALLPLCRLKAGEEWRDPVSGHIVAVADAADETAIKRIIGDGDRPTLAVNDPPYNFAVGGKRSSQLFAETVERYMDFTRRWVKALLPVLAEDCSFYIWTGADQRNGFQPLPELMMLMREFPELESRSMITMRNQRGYGTQDNWMSVRQELLYYRRGRPHFSPVYTDIPRLLKGYYKDSVSNESRSRSETIRPGNVWVDVQQVFYRLEENVPGTYAQKPVKSQERVILSSSKPGDTVIDCFSHSGSTLIACEMHDRRCITLDIDPIFAEISIRRIENYRKTGRLGWQWETPFPEYVNEGV